MIYKEIKNEVDGYLVTEYLDEAGDVIFTTRKLFPMDGEDIEVEPVPAMVTPEEVQQQTLLETQYQTVLLEMLAGF